jgi:hypothetical protein
VVVVDVEVVEVVGGGGGLFVVVVVVVDVEVVEVVGGGGGFFFVVVVVVVVVDVGGGGGCRRIRVVVVVVLEVDVDEASGAGGGGGGGGDTCGEFGGGGALIGFAGGGDCEVPGGTTGETGETGILRGPLTLDGSFTRVGSVPLSRTEAAGSSVDSTVVVSDCALSWSSSTPRATAGVPGFPGLLPAAAPASSEPPRFADLVSKAKEPSRCSSGETRSATTRVAARTDCAAWRETPVSSGKASATSAAVRIANALTHTAVRRVRGLSRESRRRSGYMSGSRGSSAIRVRAARSAT